MTKLKDSGSYGPPGAAPQMLPSVVCYADILGYGDLSRAAIVNGRGDEFLQRMYKALTCAYGAMHSHNSHDGRPLYSVKVLTDNVVVGYPVTPGGLGELELLDMLQVFAQFQTSMTNAGFLIRGGIAFGDHYMGDDVVFGPALLDAVECEKHGGAPRLVLAESARDLLQQHGEFYGDPSHAPSASYVLRDADGAWFLNYLEIAFLLFPECGVGVDLVENHAHTLENGLEHYSGEPSVRAKYEWAARYHNFVCREFARHHPVPQSSDADPEYALACEDAQRLLETLIGVEAYAPEPSPLWGRF